MNRKCALEFVGKFRKVGLILKKKTEVDDAKMIENVILEVEILCYMSVDPNISFDPIKLIVHEVNENDKNRFLQFSRY